MADVVLAAQASRVVQEAAGHVRQCHLTRIFVLKLVQAAFPAAIAECFPFLTVHLLHRNGFPVVRAQTAAVDVRHL